jgi:hypothetical protein
LAPADVLLLWRQAPPIIDSAVSIIRNSFMGGIHRWD